MSDEKCRVTLEIAAELVAKVTAQPYTEKDGRASRFMDVYRDLIFAIEAGYPSGK